MTSFHTEILVCLLDAESKRLATQSWEEVKRDGKGLIGEGVEGIIFHALWNSR